MAVFKITLACELCQRMIVVELIREKNSIVQVGCKMCQGWVKLICRDGDAWTTRSVTSNRLISGTVQEV